VTLELRLARVEGRPTFPDRLIRVKSGVAPPPFLKTYTLNRNNIFYLCEILLDFNLKNETENEPAQGTYPVSRAPFIV
jgi:hypothetical protein